MKLTEAQEFRKLMDGLNKPLTEANVSMIKMTDLLNEGKNADIARDIQSLSSGVLSSLVGFSDYKTLDKVRYPIQQWVLNSDEQFKNWQGAWSALLKHFKLSANRIGTVDDPQALLKALKVKAPVNEATVEKKVAKKGDLYSALYTVIRQKDSQEKQDIAHNLLVAHFEATGR
jgi:hypothetical protein